MKKEIYVVVKKGVYDRGIVGAFIDLKEAIEVVDVYSKAMSDGYHDYDVRKLTLGEIVSLVETEDGRVPENNVYQKECYNHVVHHGVEIELPDFYKKENK